MHNAALGATDLDYAYVAFHVAADQVRTVPAAMRALQIRGLNVTVPHKVSIMAGLDEISDEARVIGAVNTISNDDGHLTGHNTDAYGVAASLEHDGGLRTFPAKVVLLGAGGAALAIDGPAAAKPYFDDGAAIVRQLAETHDDPGYWQGLAIALGRLAGIAWSLESVAASWWTSCSHIPACGCS